MAAGGSPDKYCIIGAGAAGLTVAKNLKAEGIAFDCLERNADIGGLWNSALPGAAVYNSTHLVSSKSLSRFGGFSMPDAYPDYPSHRQVLEYFRAYAAAFGLNEAIQFKANVERAEPSAGGWRVKVAGESQARHYRGVVIANGHHSKPYWPEFPGTFSGRAMHARDYTDPSHLEGKRVLVIGGGNSGVDIAADAVQRADRVVHSMRRGYHIIPKYILGRPSDVLLHKIAKWPIPRFVRDALCEGILTLVNGPSTRFQLQKPDHRLFEAHPVISQLYPYYVGHGKIHPMPNVERFEGASAVFDNGHREEIDLVIYATGYEISIPFLDESIVFDANGRVKLLANIFHPELQNLFFVGLIQVNGGGGWSIMDHQAQVIARFITRRSAAGPPLQWSRRLRETGRSGRGRSYVKSQRHTIEVASAEYRIELARLQAALN